MKAFVQRVKGLCEITINQQTRRRFEGVGLMVLLGWEKSDESRADLDEAEEWIKQRVLGLRIFPDREGRMNLSLENFLEQSPVQGGGILWVPQFTLSASLESGFRPSFIHAMAAEKARLRYENFLQPLQPNLGGLHFSGEFGADMDIAFCNWGPVSLPLQQ